MERRTNARVRSTLVMGLIAAAALVNVRYPAAQSFNSGSNGSDGALNVPPNQGTILFDPSDTARWGRVLDPDGDGVYHFTTITIGSGTILRLRADKVSSQVHWLATGDVVLNGGLDLTGENGLNTTSLLLRRQPAIPGSGGYPGGLGGKSAAPAAPATP